jgi:hypothetical protein
MPRPRGASITVMPAQVDDDLSDAMRWESDVEPVNLYTIDARLARIEALVQYLIDKEPNP